MLNDPEKLTIINRLLASFPTTQSGQGDDALDGYLIGIAEIPAEFVAKAAARFLSGSVSGQHTTFPPSPAQLATEARMHWYTELERQREECLRLAPPPPEAEIPEAERERVKAGFAALHKRLAAEMRTDEAAAAAREKERWAKVNARFMPDMSEDAVRKRLGFSVGDRDGDRDMGNAA